MLLVVFGSFDLLELKHCFRLHSLSISPTLSGRGSTISSRTGSRARRWQNKWDDPPAVSRWQEEKAVPVPPPPPPAPHLLRVHRKKLLER